MYLFMTAPCLQRADQGKRSEEWRQALDWSATVPMEWIGPSAALKFSLFYSVVSGTWLDISFKSRHDHFLSHCLPITQS